MQAAIRAISYHLPARALTNVQLAEEYPDWGAAKIEQKTGIRARQIAGEEECASDLAVAAARLLFETAGCAPDQVDYLLFCTQSPDYFLPTTACLLQDRLGLPRTIGALDYNLGCSGFVYGLGLAKGLIETGQARNVLLLTAETYSKFIHPQDRSVRTLFGDAAAATLVQGVDTAAPGGDPWIGPFVFGTDGQGAKRLIVPAGGMRRPRSAETARAERDAQGNTRAADNLYMDGAEIMSFTLQAVPRAVADLLDRAGKRLEEIDLFVFHQANRFMLEHLRDKLDIPEQKFIFALRDCGNTVSSTIPIALKEASDTGRLKRGDLVMLVGFGVGYSWGANLVRWDG